MKRLLGAGPLLSLIIILLSGGCVSHSSRDELFQVSLIDALLAGEYDGAMTFGELRRYGDFGLGTFDRLNGEMVAVDGRFYQALADGRVRLATDKQTTPFAAVTFFKPDQRFEIDTPMEMATVNDRIDARLASLNWFYAIRIDGVLAELTLRSVPAQSKPYPPLEQIIQHQSVWRRTYVTGTLVGLRCPIYATGLNVPGYHWHFVRDDRALAGHVLDFRIREGVIQIDRLESWTVWLPNNQGFGRLDLSRDRAAALDKVEKQ